PHSPATASAYETRLRNSSQPDPQRRSGLPRVVRQLDQLRHPSHGKQNPLSDPRSAAGKEPGTAALDASDRRPPQGDHTIATVPFTLRNLKEDLEDLGSRFDGAPDLEFRMATEALELERSGLSYQRVPPGYRFPYG